MLAYRDTDLSCINSSSTLTILHSQATQSFSSPNGQPLESLHQVSLRSLSIFSQAGGYRLLAARDFHGGKRR